MKSFREGELKNGINRFLDDTQHTVVKAGMLGGYGADNWIRIKECLVRWENEGILKILIDPEGLPSDTPCIEMLKYIHQRSSIPGFLNWEELQ